MNIRESKSEELNFIRLAHEDAFGEPEGKVLAQLVCDILADESAKPMLSLVRKNRVGVKLCSRGQLTP